MHVVLHVFERKDPSAGTLTWATLGLGKLDQVLSLRSPTKLRARIVEGLKRAVGEATRHELRLLSAPRPRLERVRLELVLRAERTRKQTAVFPLIFDRRRTAGGEITAIEGDEIALELWIRNADGAVTTPGQARVRLAR